ncbi:selenocysteine-specific translation elongation factor [Treponema vincentii ATCC 35580]|uniref:Selenocysteine-specific translation elongation factor n=1 Tax=Treponema vincentii ATCC 35580 TaxID=596324 RepID=C8PLW7_9SPIR|nr:selenocysteine-specific translation elongation factor [Treponema vincentii]EEV21605.1 selenocysteine-specific translation elongation factor [Treponema vincentii ATCC 35580]
MAYILGTAGHVDHGKTALVKCLTGVETSHIPEEKKRGMTIELGFASLQDPVHGTVGIVDVPGHERFIRNMVAGTWGLDAAMLIVAADDGWMQMSSDHLRVLKAMHIESILLVITKSDLADADMIELIREDANRHCREILGRELPSVAVSAQTGAGIDLLKSKITELLSTVHTAPLDKPFLYVDRVFTLKGIGITVTGTLRGKSVTVGDQLSIYPGGTECKIKNIQNHHADVTSSESGMRTALNLKIEKEKIERGMLLAGSGESPILQGTELLVRVDEYFNKQESGAGIKNHIELELATGSTNSIGAIHFNKTDPSLARVSLQEPIAGRWNQPAVLIRHGGSAILASCRILAAFDSYRAAVFKQYFTVYAGRELPSWKSSGFFINGYIEKDRAEPKELSAEVKDVTPCGKWLLFTQKLAEWEAKILETAKKSQAGFTVEEIDASVPVKVRQDILKKLCAENKLAGEGSTYKQAGSGNTLSKTAQQLLQLALKAGFDGIEIDKIQLPQVRKDARDLVKLGKLVVLEDFLHYHREIYDKAIAAILKGKKAGDIITIADARNATNLSRKYVIPLLNVLEKNGKVKRQENDRIVL